MQPISNGGGGLHLGIVIGEDGRAVLVADIGTLAVELGGIVNGEEHFAQSLERNLLGVEGHFDHFGVAGVVVADVAVGGIFRVPA